MKTFTLAALGLAALASVPAAAANWSDTYLGYQWSNQFRDPGIAQNETKSRIELSGVYGWDYGTNFFDVNMLAAASGDPANNAGAVPGSGFPGTVNTNAGQPQKGVPGDTEVYVVYRSNFDLGKIFKTNMAFGPVREVDFTVGFDFDSTDNQFASNKKFFMGGVQFGFDVSKGFWNLGVGGCREKNYNGIVMQEVNFKTDWMVWTAWHKAFNLGSVPMAWKGWANVLGAKGKDGFAAYYNQPDNTRPESLGDTYVMADVSSLFGRKAGAIFVGPGFEYWHNKFGDRTVSFNDPAVTGPGGGPYNANADVHAFMIAVEFHF
jgi:nucleoside-specific outer membrane channel protein Tsx